MQNWLDPRGIRELNLQKNIDWVQDLIIAGMEKRLDVPLCLTVGYTLRDSLRQGPYYALP